MLCTPPPNGPLRNTNNNVTLNTATAGDLLQIVCAKNACQRTFFKHFTDCCSFHSGKMLKFLKTIHFYIGTDLFRYGASY